MAFQLPSLRETREFAVAVFKALFPDRNAGSKRSYHGRRLTVLAAVATQVHAHVDSVTNDVMPDRAPDGEPINRWGAIVGVDRKPATPSRKAAALRVRGTAGATASIGEPLVHQVSGLRFQLASSVTIPGAPPLEIDADVIAIDTGAATRLEADEVLEFEVQPANIELQAVLVKDLDEDGYDEEQYGAYRARMLATFGSPSSGGSQSDYERWALEIPGIARAYVYPNRAGFGTVDVAVLHTGSGSARIPLAGELADALTYLKTKAPAHIAGTPGALRVLTPIADPKSVEIKISPNGEAANAFDFDDTIAPVVVAWTAATRTLQMTTNGVATIPSTMKAGHRIVLGGVATVQDGTELKIESVTGADTVVLETAPTAAPAGTDIIYSGGPLVTPIRKAILAHMNGEIVYAGRGGVPVGESTLIDEDKTSIGLEVITEGIGTANPAGAYGTWNGGLIADVLRQIAMSKSGVRKTTLVTPAADYEATDFAFPNDAQIGLITPSVVLVRKG